LLYWRSYICANLSRFYKTILHLLNRLVYKCFNFFLFCLWNNRIRFNLIWFIYVINVFLYDFLINSFIWTYLVNFDFFIVNLYFSICTFKSLDIGKLIYVFRFMINNLLILYIIFCIYGLNRYIINILDLIVIIICFILILIWNTFAIIN